MRMVRKVSVTATVSDGRLAGARPDTKKRGRESWSTEFMTGALAARVAGAGDGTEIEVDLHIDTENRVAVVTLPGDPPPAMRQPTPRTSPRQEPSHSRPGNRRGNKQPSPRQAPGNATGAPPEGTRARLLEPGDALNPYTFVPTPPRTKVPEGLGDAEAPPLATIGADAYSGRLVLTLRTVTPMLLPKKSPTQQERRPPLYDLMKDEHGKPLVHGAAIKGALRSAYETVTNSRYGVFRGHELPLAYREPVTRDSHSMVVPTLDSSLSPASTPAELSPADRLFGWVPPSGSKSSGSSGQRGRLRVKSVACRTGKKKAVRGFSPPLTIGPLQAPKPTQFRFYAAAAGDPEGRPIPDGTERNPAGYNGAPRGRKYYWRPEVEATYWDQNGPPLPEGRSREWQPAGQKETQVSSHTAWVKPDAEFQVTLWLDDVPTGDLAPLLWMLSQPRGTTPLRLGRGKPYGFGAVSVAIDWPSSELWSGATVRQSWRNVTPPTATPREEFERLAECYEKVAREEGLARVLDAWQATTRGRQEPLHYPRTTENPEAETYKWFVANDAAHGPKLALPDVLDPDPRLPRRLT